MLCPKGVERKVFPCAAHVNECETRHRVLHENPSGISQEYRRWHKKEIEVALRRADEVKLPDAKLGGMRACMLFTKAAPDSKNMGRLL